MNRFCGDPAFTSGVDARTVYLIAALSGAAFMQLPATGGYIRPGDVEKGPIIERLSKEGMEGDGGMTLVVAGGLSPANIGRNMEILGSRGRMFLAGTSVYSHPGGIKAGMDALKLAVRAYSRGATSRRALRGYAKTLGEEGLPLEEALRAV